MPAVWTAPRTWVAGELVTASIGNAAWRDNFMYLKDSPTFDGAVTVTGALTLTGALVGNAVTDSTSTLTGAIQTDGGLGVVKALWVGGTINSTAPTNVLLNTAVGIAQKQIVIGNTSGTTLMGVESSVGGTLATGVPAYGSVIGSLTSLSLATAGVERVRVSAVGGVALTGTLAVNGASTLSGAVDVGGVLTSTGAVVANSTLTAVGVLAANGGITVDTTAFTVADTTGNTTTGTLTVNTAGGNVTWGTYTPTLTNGTNVDASTPRLCVYTRVGNSVTVHGAVSVDATSATTSTGLQVSLPIASDLASTYDLSGVMNATGANTGLGIMSADTTNNTALATFFPSDTNNRDWRFTFQYTVL